MKTGRTDYRRQRAVRLAGLLLALLFAVLPALSAADDAPAMPEFDPTLILAQNAVIAYGLRGADGQPLKPHKAEDLEGRGRPAVAGEEPDYIGVIGYISLQTEWEVSRFSTFTETPWLLPVYEMKGDGWTEVGSVKHKTPVLVVKQVLREALGHKYTGYLQVVRLDTHHMVWIDVKNFVTVPYWTYELTEAVKHGYVIAVYSDKSRNTPVDRKKHRGAIPDGTRVLMCDKNTSRYFSPDKANNPLLGIVFRSKNEGEAYLRTFLFFNADDLQLVY